MDMLTVLYNKLIEDDYIKTQTTGRIKFYVYPESASLIDPHIVIDPLDAPNPGDYADDKPMTDSYLFQVDVWTKDRLITKELAKRVQNQLFSMGLRRGFGGADDYDKETGIYRDARRYRAKVYTDEIKALL